MTKRIVLAYLIAPAVPWLLDALLRVIKSGAAGELLTLSQLFTPFLLLVSYFCAAVIGLPLYLLAKRILAASWWRYVICGGVIGCVPALLILMTAGDSTDGLGEGIALVAAAIGGIYGAVAGTAFWLIGLARWGRQR